MMIAAMNHTDYESSKACGAYVRVQAANGAGPPRCTGSWMLLNRFDDPLDIALRRRVTEAQ